MNLFFFDEIYKKLLNANRNIEKALLYDNVWGNVFDNFENNDKILILGAGIGGTTRILRKYTNKLYNFDISFVGLQYMRNHINKDMFFICANANKKLPFKNDVFDYVIDDQLIVHIKVQNRLNIYKEIYRILKNEGKFFMYNVINRDRKNFFMNKYFEEKENLLEKLDQIGLKFDYMFRARKEIQILIFRKILQ